MIRKSTLHAHGAQPQTFPHGGACSVKPEHWDLQIYISKRSGDELCQKIPRKRIPDFFLRKPALLDHKTCSPAVKLTLRLLPAFLSQHGIQLHPVKKTPRGPSPSFFPTVDAAAMISGGFSNTTLARPRCFLNVPVFSSIFLSTPIFILVSIHLSVTSIHIVLFEQKRLQSY